MAKIVDIVIGSMSDWPLVDASNMTDVLNSCGVEWDIHVISAHRNPNKLREYCEGLSGRGVGVVIAAAGMSAALPGVIGSYLGFERIIIGVPLPSEGFPDARDARDAMERMPPSCPVLTCGIGQIGLKNAAIAAIQMLAVCSDDLVSANMRKSLHAYLEANKKEAQISYRSSRQKKEVEK